MQTNGFLTKIIFAALLFNVSAWLYNHAVCKIGLTQKSGDLAGNRKDPTATLMRVVRCVFLHFLHLLQLWWVKFFSFFLSFAATKLFRVEGIYSNLFTLTSLYNSKFELTSFHVSIG
jgi:hypothetical protein